MKRALLFFGLLLLGLGILTVFSGWGGPERGEETGTTTQPRSAADAAGDTPLTAFTSTKGQVPEGVGISALEGLTRFMERKGMRDGTKLPDMELRIAVLRPNRDGSAGMTKPVLTIPSLTGGEPEAEIEGESGRGYFAGDPPSPTAGPWQFENATIRYRDPKSKLGMVTLTCSRIDARFEMVDKRVTIRSLSTSEPFQVTGDFIRGSGIGLDLDIVKGEYRILKEPSIDLRPGATPKLKARLRMRSTGVARIVDGASRQDTSLEVKFQDNAVFRQEREGVKGFFEIEGRSLSMRLDRQKKGTADDEAIVPRSFDATGNVLYKTPTLDGRCVQAFGSFNAAQILSDLTLVGPYRAEVKVARGKQTLPGFGSPETLTLTGSGLVKSHLVDAATEKYHWVADGSPRISFAEPGAREPAYFAADHMEGDYVKSNLTAFSADRNVVIHSLQGHLTADHAELAGTDPDRSLILTSALGVDMVFAGDALASGARPTPAGGKPPSRAPLNLNARKVTISPKPGAAGSGAKSTKIVAEGDVKGKAIDTDGSEVKFSAQKLETSVGDSVERTVTLTAAVMAEFVARRIKIEGEYLAIHESPALDTASAASTLLFRKGELRGAPALLTMGESDDVKRTILSPYIWFTNEIVHADGPVEVMVPADSIAAGSTPRKAAEAPEFVWITGRRLEARMDSAGRPVNATIFGPLDSRGAYTIVGERLTLDFRQGQHSLVGREGVRASIRRPKKPGSPGFYAEAPRMDMEGDSQALTLAGGGLVVIEGAPLGLQQFGAKDSVDTTSDNILRFTASRAVRITPARVTFEGDVVATGEGREPWALESGRLDVDMNEARQPARVTAAGDVYFKVPGRIEGRAEELRYSEASRLMELDGSTARTAVLLFAGGRFEGAWLKCNLRTFLVESGPAQLSASTASIPRPSPR